MKNLKKISIASDHAGLTLKIAVIAYLKKCNFEVFDNGPFDESSVDYPDFAKKVAINVSKEETKFGILICGSGQGMAITANKYPGIRAALCYNPEIAILSRAHNDANILTLGARFIDETEALNCVDKFLNTPFEGGRHLDRVNKIL